MWLIEDHPKRKAMWTRVGVAFENNDGSWALQLAAVPTGANRLQVRDPRPIEANTEAGAIHDAANDDDDVRVAA